MNIYHEGFLCWNFHTAADRGKIAYDSAVDDVKTGKVLVSKEKDR